MFSFVVQEQTITSSTEKLVKFSREWFHNYSSSKPKDKLLLKQLMAFCLNYYFHQLLESFQDSVQENITFIVLITKKIIRQEILTRIVSLSQWYFDGVIQNILTHFIWINS